jgi:hypothetical protein
VGIKIKYSSHDFGIQGGINLGRYLISTVAGVIRREIKDLQVKLNKTSFTRGYSIKISEVRHFHEERNKTLLETDIGFWRHRKDFKLGKNDKSCNQKRNGFTEFYFA